MLPSLKRALSERIRVAKHNWLDGVGFRLRYRAGWWDVRTADGERFRFPYNPYSVFYETEGYLAGRRWTLEPGMVVLDAGACYGEFSLYACRRVGPTGRVLMMEPDADNVRRAKEVFDANGGWPANVTLVDQGLWKEPGELSFAAGLGTDSYLVDAEGAPQASSREDKQLTSIRVTSLPALVEQYSLTRLDLVKMDIEGAEVEAVQGAGDVLARLKPNFAIAAYHRRDGVQTCKLLEPLFRQAGYHTGTGYPLHLTTYASVEPLPKGLVE